MSTPRKLLQTLTVLCLLASACTPAKTALPETLVAVSTASQTPAPIPTLTLTQPPTDIASTPPLTPLPIIPSFTPTFDARTIVTVTPGASAKCLSNSSMEFAIPTRDPAKYLKHYKTAILNFINKGGALGEVYNKFHSNINTRNGVYFEDVTNDGTPELIFGTNDGDGGGGNIYGCNPKNLKYELLYQPPVFNPDDYYQLVGTKDMNLNGMPDVVILNTGCIGGKCSEIFVVEWDGEKFRNLIQDSEFASDSPEWAYASSLTKIELADLDDNGTIELIWKGGVEWPWTYPKAQLRSYYREETHVYSWNGVRFSPLPVRYTPAIYRFQAINDADQATEIGEYDLAFSLYQDAIFNDKLDSWSKEREMQLMPRLESWFGTPTPTAFPEDKSEYSRLAAYAYYRMIILHTHLGEMEAAAIKYTTLQEKFPAESPGHPYAEMASSFWNAYQSAQNVVTACGAAIQYAVENPDILVVLGSHYHGWQSHTYVPTDVCPFR